MKCEENLEIKIVDAQGPSASLGRENENKIVNHILKLQSMDLLLLEMMCKLWFLYWQIKHRFNRESGKARYD